MNVSRPLAPFRRLRITCRKKIVEGVREVEGRKFVGCDGSLNAFAKRELPLRLLSISKQAEAIYFVLQR